MTELTSSNRLVFDLTFVQDAFNEMEDFMKKKENLMKFLVIASRRFSHIQDTAIKLAYARLLNNAEGQFLTDLAEKLNIQRGDQNDKELRSLIKFKALTKSSEGTRSDIYKLLKVVSGDGYVKLFKGSNNYVEATFSAECLKMSVVGEDIENIFPVNTNLLATSVITGTKPIGAGWSNTDGTETISEKLGVSGWDGVFPDDNTGYTSSIIISSDS